MPLKYIHSCGVVRFEPRSKHCGENQKENNYSWKHWIPAREVECLHWNVDKCTANIRCINPGSYPFLLAVFDPRIQIGVGNVQQQNRNYECHSVYDRDSGKQRKV